MYLMQIFVPTRDNQGSTITERQFTALRSKLTDRFGGETTYARTPVEEMWKPSENSAEVDHMIIYEVVFDELEAQYWKGMKSQLEKAIRRQQIMMRYLLSIRSTSKSFHPQEPKYYIARCLLQGEQIAILLFPVPWTQE